MESRQPSLTNIARHVIQRTLNPSFLSYMAPNDVASNPTSLDQGALDDVTNHVSQALPRVGSPAAASALRAFPRCRCVWSATPHRGPPASTAPSRRGRSRPPTVRSLPAKDPLLPRSGSVRVACGRLAPPRPHHRHHRRRPRRHPRRHRHPRRRRPSRRRDRGR
jgi:hypothetical protein